MFIFKIIEADLRLNRGVAGGYLGCNEMPRPAFHSFPGFLGYVGVSSHTKPIKRTGTNYPSIPLTAFDLLCLLCLAFINAEAAACFQWSMG
ncbi:MAG: hypothetical protein DESF_02426 [Desulfovibrio sp.]